MKLKLLLSLYLAALVQSLFSQSAAPKINPYNYTITKKIEVNNGAVVSAHPLASKVGLSILENFQKKYTVLDEFPLVHKY